CQSWWLADVLARLIPVAAIHPTTGPDTHGIALAHVSVQRNRNLSPSLRSDHFLEEILRNVMRQNPTFQLIGASWNDKCQQGDEYGYSHKPSARSQTFRTPAFIIVCVPARSIY